MSSRYESSVKSLSESVMFAKEMINEEVTKAEKLKQIWTIYFTQVI